MDTRNHEELERFFRLSPDLFLISDFEGLVRHANPAWERVLGWTPAALAGRPLLDLVHPEDRERAEAEIRRLHAGAENAWFEVRLGAQDGGWRWLYWTAVSSPPMARVYAVARDVTDQRRRDESRVRRMGRESFRLLIEQAEEVITILGPDERVRYASPALERILGRDPERAQDEPFFDWVHPQDRDAGRAWFQQVIGKSAEAPLECRFVRADGQARVLQTAGRNLLDEPRVAGIVLSSRDVTSSRRLEDQLRQAQKMEVLGRLAGGIAHDFNNVLTLINGYAEIARTQMDEDSGAREMVTHVLHAGRRGALLTRQLLAFSRQQVLERKVLDLNVVAGDAEKMIRHMVGADVQVTIERAGSPAPIRADPGQVEQVILNLAVNARDAMPRGGTLTIAVRVEDVDEAGALRYPGAVPGPYVRLSVKDSGTGIPEDILPHIFEPFFTTKEAGRGTGLGLATVFGIVRQAGGGLAVTSRTGSGSGTTFDVLWPRTGATPAGPRENSLPPLTGGSETILVVDDETGVREIARHNLTRAGYRVLEAPGPGEALLIVEQEAGPIDLLLADVVMPLLSGPGLASRLGARVRRVLYLSGYPGRIGPAQEAPPDDAAVLAKPFSRQELLAKVRAVLDEPDGRKT